MSPATVLASLAALGGSLPARTLLVGCQVAATDDGLGLTPPVEAAVGAAVVAVRDLVMHELRPTEVA
jgi:hydrogenase maturation protease